MFNKIFLLLIGLVFFFVIIQPISSLTASSENYSIARFGTGVQATNLNSADLTGRAILLANAGTRNAENDNLFVNIGFWANTSYHVTVSITSYSMFLPSPIAISIIRLSISALNAQSTWARITRPDGVNETVVLLNNDYAYYTVSLVGRYDIIFYANSSSGMIASAVDHFDLLAETPPIIPPSSGGGGGGTTTIIEKCVYNWDCTPWSICSEGKQRRECKNIGTCNGTESKPIEEMPCSEALFDIIMTFKEIGLTPDRILRFNIDLKETNSVKKIDIQIKYSIIDRNNNEILSQIETRAIEGNLTYEKELNEAKLIDGDYILRVDMLYGNLQRASAEQRFRIREGVIEIVEPASITQKIMEFLQTNYLIFIFILSIMILTFIIFIYKKRVKKNSLKQELKSGSKLISRGKTNEARLVYENIRKAYNPGKDTNKKMYNKIMNFYHKILKSNLLIIFVGLVGVIALLFSLLNLNITAGVIGNASSSNKVIISASLIIISIFASVIILRRKFIGLFSKSRNKHKKYSANSIKGLINKKVYSDNGNYIGEIKDVILGKNKIESLKIKVDKKHKFKRGGISINYKNVRSVSEIMIIDKTVTEHLENYEDSKKI